MYIEYVFVYSVLGFVIFGLPETFGRLKDTQKAINNRQRQMIVKLETKHWRCGHANPNAALTSERCLNAELEP